MADLQPGALPTVFTVGTGTDIVPVSRGAQTGRMTLSEFLGPSLAAKADILGPVAETGTAWNITEAGHAYREVTGSNASAITATFVFTGMVAGQSSGIIRQGSAGVITLAGATVLYAPHLSTTQGNSPTTGTVRGWIEWVFRGGSTVEIVARSEDASGGGGYIQDERATTATAAAGSTPGVGETLTGATLNMTALAVGQVLRLTGVCGLGNWAAATMTQAFFRLYVNDVLGAQFNFNTNNRSLEFDIPFVVRATSGAGALIAPPLDYRSGEVSNNPPVAMSVTVSGAFAITAQVQRQTATDVAFTLEWLRATVE